MNITIQVDDDKVISLLQSIKDILSSAFNIEHTVSNTDNNNQLARSPKSSIGTTGKCLYCGKDFVKAHSRQKYCSKECRMSKVSSFVTKKMVGICDVCGKEFDKDTYDRKRCSAECGIIYARWKAGPMKRGITLYEYTVHRGYRKPEEGRPVRDFSHEHPDPLIPPELLPEEPPKPSDPPKTSEEPEEVVSETLENPVTTDTPAQEPETPEEPVVTDDKTNVDDVFAPMNDECDSDEVDDDEDFDDEEEFDDVEDEDLDDEESGVKETKPPAKPSAKAIPCQCCKTLFEPSSKDDRFCQTCLDEYGLDECIQYAREIRMEADAAKESKKIRWKVCPGCARDFYDVTGQKTFCEKCSEKYHKHEGKQ